MGSLVINAGQLAQIKGCSRNFVELEAMKKTQLRSLKCLFVIVMLLGLTACAAGGTMVHHSFSFDTIGDSPIRTGAAQGIDNNHLIFPGEMKQSCCVNYLQIG